jgi:hypothetical protein
MVITFNGNMFIVTKSAGNIYPLETVPPFGALCFPSAQGAAVSPL